MRKKYLVENMTCASCANHVYDAVIKIDGVTSCNVNLLLNEMEVETSNDNDLTSLIKEAVFDAGYIIKDYQLTTNNKKDKKELYKLIISICLMLLLSYLSMHQMFSLPIIKLLNKQYFFLNNLLAQFILTSIIYAINYKRIYNGFKQLLKNKPTMDSLISLSCISCYVYGLIILIQIILKVNVLTTQLFLESGAMVLCFSNIGKYLETNAKVKTTSALTNLLNIAPTIAYLYKDNKPIKIKAEEIHVDDILLVKPGGKIPVDGIVIQGMSYCDQSIITGEALPVEKKVNDKVISSSVNLNSSLIIKATTSYFDSTYSKIIDLVNQAAYSKAPISSFADIVSKYFIYIVISLSLFTFIIWFLLTKNFSTSFNYAMSVLTISCPCALGLATPTAIMACSGKGATLGIVYKNAAIIEETSKIDTILFDKTNTITKGVFKVMKEDILVQDTNYYDLIYSLQIKSNHPLANSLVDYILPYQPVNLMLDVKEISSSGVVACYQNHTYGIGNNRLLQQYQIKQIIVDDSINTILYFFKDNEILSVFHLNDTLKENIKDVIHSLDKYKISMLTGDNKAQAEYIAKQVSISDVHSQLLPKDKAELVKYYQNNNHCVAMIGDGINDTVALNYANVAIAVNDSTDIAIQCSDIILMNDDSCTIVNTFNLANKTMKIIKENLFWALGYNCLLIPIASGLFSFLSITLNPMYSSLAMSLSSITVVLNALRINLFKPLKIVSDTNSYSYTLYIDHMMCEHCQKAVSNALLDLNIIATTELKHSTASFKTAKKVNIDLISQKLENIGYKIIKVIEK